MTDGQLPQETHTCLTCLDRDTSGEVLPCMTCLIVKGTRLLSDPAEYIDNWKARG